MPHSIKLPNVPAGYAVTGGTAGQQVAVQTREFTSSEDGQHFITRLEGLPSDLLARSRPGLFPSQVDHMLAVIQSDGSAQVYINELTFKMRVQMGRKAEKGQPIYAEDIVDIQQFVPDGVEIPPEAGVLFLFSVGWRRGLFYDLNPCAGPSAPPRTENLFELFGRFHAYIRFQERFGISEEEWARLIDGMWFPFAGLGNLNIAKLLRYVRSGLDLDELVPEFVDWANAQAGAWLTYWRDNRHFANHLEILEKAIERFRAKDYLSSTSLMFPRIEGIMRDHHTEVAHEKKLNQSTMVSSTTAPLRDNEASLLLPIRFEQYLERVFFKGFEQGKPSGPISRHSLAHGVARAGEFTPKAALSGLLVLCQLHFFTSATVGDKAK